MPSFFDLFRQRETGNQVRKLLGNKVYHNCPQIHTPPKYIYFRTVVNPSSSLNNWNGRNLRLLPPPPFAIATSPYTTPFPPSSSILFSLWGQSQSQEGR